jgi:hypothetical protein
MLLTWAAEPHRGASPCPADDPLPAKTARSSRTRRALGGGAGSRLRKVCRVLAWIRIRDANQVSREDVRRDVNPAVIGVSLAETAETPRGLPAVANVSAPVLIGVTLAEIAEIPSPARSGDQRFAHQGFAGSSNDRNAGRSGDWCLQGAFMLLRTARVPRALESERARRSRSGRT